MMAAETKEARIPIKKKDVVVPLPAKLVAGGIAGVIGTTLIFPLDMVKTRLQNSGVGKGPVYSGPVDCFKRTLAAEGFKGLYNGLRPNLLGVFPEKALKLSVNDTCREFFTRQNPDGKIKVYQEIIAGGTAGLIQVAVTK
jgi:Mitochondrial carrier protein